MGAIQRWSVGAITVTLLRESLTPVDPAGLFPDVDVAAVFDANAEWLRPNFVNDDGTLPLSIHCLVVESMGQTIVIDTCIGDRPVPGFAELSNAGPQFLEDFAAAGFDRTKVDYVACTHLHFDHVGWNTMLVDGVWVPTFPNARYIFGKTEYEYWDAGNPGTAVTFADAVRSVFEAGLADLVDVHHRINAEVYFAPTPGHTPGHVSVHLSSGGEHAVITGDMAHHPIQLAAGIDWPMVADHDSAMAAATRRTFRDAVVDQAVLIIGTHFAPPTAGHLRRRSGQHRFEA